MFLSMSVPVPVEQDMIQGQLCKKEYQDTEPKIIQYQGYTLCKILAPSILGERGGGGGRLGKKDIGKKIIRDKKNSGKLHKKRRAGKKLISKEGRGGWK